MTDKDIRKIARMVGQTVSKALSPLNRQLSGVNKSISGINKSISGINEQISGINDQLSGINGQLSTVEEKLDSQTVDIHDLQEQVKGLQVEVVANTEINKRRIDEVREHVGLPASS